MSISSESTMIETGRPAGKRPVGRPRGSTEGTPQIDLEGSRCPVCGSTDRDNYYGTVVRDFNMERDGIVYKTVTIRRTKCLSCGQHRIDRTYK